MSYTVIVPKPVQKQLDDLANNVRDRVVARIALLAEDPLPPGAIKLQGYENTYRIRIGDYRVVYEINDEESIVVLLRCKQALTHRFANEKMSIEPDIAFFDQQKSAPLVEDAFY